MRYLFFCRKFAINVGLKFFTPEEFFLRQDPVPFRIGPYDPRFEAWGGETLGQDSLRAKALDEMPRVVVMVRPPGLEEAATFREYFAEKGRNVVIHSKDEMLPEMSTGIWLIGRKHPKKICGSWLLTFLVIDTTEPSTSVRSALLRSLTLPKQDVGCLWLYREVPLVWHFHTWCIYRHWKSWPQNAEPIDTDVLKAELNSWMRKLDDPQLSEGYSTIFRPRFKVRSLLAVVWYFMG